MPLFSRLTLTQFAIAIFMGALPLLFLPQLPHLYWLLCLFFICLWMTKQKLFVLQWVAVVLFSFIWVMSQAHWQMMLQHKFKNQSVNISGVVKQANIGQPLPTQVLVKVLVVNGQSLPFGQTFLVRLSWRDTQPFISGQQITVQTTLFPIWGRLNEGGFDKARWAMANRILFEGTAKSITPISAEADMRQIVIDHVRAKVKQLPYYDILLALAFGERGLMTAYHRELLVKTGTAHLMAISGLHIALAGLFGIKLIRCCQHFFPLRWIEPRFPLIGGCMVAGMYVWLSGANPPALRAWLAMGIWCALRCFCAQWRPWQSFCCIVAILVVIDPFIVLSSSFWLSVSAVAILFILSQWRSCNFHSQRWWHRVVTWLKWQCALVLLLTPLQIYLFHGVSFSAVLANSVAIPWLSFITVPLIFLGLLLMPFSAFFWFLADQSLEWVFWILAWFDWGWLTVRQAHVVLSLVLVGLFLGWQVGLWARYRGLAIVLLGGSLLPSWQQNRALWRVDMLDVGHGLAVVISQQNKALIYDVGAAWQGGSMASREILPYLMWQGWHLEGVIISHRDNDHAGGLADIRQHYPHVWLKSSDLGLASQGCVAGQTWVWQRLSFEVLWPNQAVARAVNADSCVIRVSDGRFSVLLTGDIGQPQEAQLVQFWRDKLPVTLLQVPHHGSATSSSSLFLRHVKPVMAWSANAQRTPWRLPHPDIQARYQSQQIDWYSTADSGQLTLLFYQDTYQMQAIRRQYRRWYHP